MLESWKVMDFAPGEGRDRQVFQPGFDDSAWVDVPAPGDVHRALMAAGRIPDPFYDRNESEVSWMETREFWYRARFPGGPAPTADERVVLFFHGLDTYAMIYLNGKLLGRSQNMFREALFDVTGKLIPGRENVLAIRFDPPLSHLEGADNFRSTWGRNVERVFMRKAQFGYGWDWGPRLPTIGIWRPVEIRRLHTAALLGVQFNTLRLEPDHSAALCMLRVEASRFIPPVKGASEGQLKAEIRLSAPGEKKPVVDDALALDAPDAEQNFTIYINVPAPKLWWTNGLGEPFLYDLKVTLRKGKEVLDVWEQQVGIRTLALDQSPDPDEPGTRFFRFVLNGTPIFARGANWIPADSFVGAIPDGQYERLISMARNANMNMLRVWGGGIYEHDVFYNLCDRLGILVWQDFMFSCAMYPEEPQSFVTEVDAEARYQVRRLRSHACMALWCGNNENQWLHDRSRPEAFPEKVPGTLYYDKILPRAVAELDGMTPYWPGSPFGGNDYNSMEDGDRHNWDVWHGNLPRRFGEPVLGDHTPEGVSFRHYAEDMGRFISEFGMHAAPVFETLRRVIPEDQRYHHSPSMDHHNKDNPKNKGDNLMETVTGLPEGLEEYIDFSMIAQAEGLKFGIEHWRRRMPHTAGAIIWQLNDCWPVLSWSLVDYYGFGKAGYYYARRVFHPLLVSFKEEPEGAVSLWITNERKEPFEGQVLVKLSTFAGQQQWQEAVTARVPANTSVEVARWSAADLGPAPDRYLSARSTDGSFPINRHFFAAIKDLRREAGAPEVTFQPSGEHEMKVEIKAGPSYAYFFHLTHPSEHTRYEDNYFDLEPNETRTIRVWNETQPLRAEDFTARSR